MADINYDDLCNLIALEVGQNASVKSVKRYLRAIYKVILSQLKLNHRILFKDFGYWEIKERKSGEREINNPNGGGKRLVYVRPKYSIFFKSSINFDASVNDNDFKITTKRKMRLAEKERNTEVTYTDLLNRANKRSQRKE